MRYEPLLFHIITFRHLSSQALKYASSQLDQIRVHYNWVQQQQDDVLSQRQAARKKIIALQRDLKVSIFSALNRNRRHKFHIVK